MATLPRRHCVAAALLAFAAQALAADPTPAERMASQCAAVPAAPTQAPEIATRAQCLLANALASPDRFAEARGLARQLLQQGDAGGGVLLYLAFSTDPANVAVRDQEAYTRLAARSLEERRGQIEAIEGLGLAAGKGNLAAGVLLAHYFHDTVAPQNVARVRALTGLLLRGGERPPELDRMAREADAIERVGRSTKASVRSFLQAHQHAVAAASHGYKAQAAGGTCDKPTLKAVSSGDIAGAEYLPLKGTMVANSYLLRGDWSEYWLFQACDQEVPVKVSFRADGWGGSSFIASHNKGE